MLNMRLQEFRPLSRLPHATHGAGIPATLQAALGNHRAGIQATLQPASGNHRAGIQATLACLRQPQGRNSGHSRLPQATTGQEFRPLYSLPQATTWQEFRQLQAASGNHRTGIQATLGCLWQPPGQEFRPLSRLPQATPGAGIQATLQAASGNPRTGIQATLQAASGNPRGRN